MATVRDTGTDKHIRTQTLAHALYTHVHCNIVVWSYSTFCIADMLWCSNVIRLAVYLLFLNVFGLQEN